MTDGTDLLAAILANPAEDTPRLMYADWLQEHGDEARAEFIRVQVELAGLERRAAAGETPTLMIAHGPNPSPVAMSGCQFANPDGAAAGLLKRAEDLWHQLIERPTIAAVRWRELAYRRRAQFRRGFVAAVTCTAEDWLAHADALVAAHPIERVTLTTMPRPDNLQARRQFQSVGQFFNFVQRYGGEDGWTRLLRDDWPGIAFTLPPAGESYLVGLSPPTYTPAVLQSGTATSE